MRKLFPLLVTALFAFAALGESAHFHEDACDAPCPAVCSGSSCGAHFETASARQLAVQEEPSAPAFQPFEPVLAHQLLEDEIFHPPLG